MIARLEGKLVVIDGETALVQVGQVGYEVMLPGCCIVALADKIGAEIALCTMEYYEGTPAGGNLIPRMVGFLNASDRAFFGRYTTVKGMGIKKALRSLSVPIPTIAAAIENGDDKTLLALPGIGKRMAQQMIAELKGKLEAFAVGAAPDRPAGEEFRPFQIEALEILIAWGEKRAEAMELIDMACGRHPEVSSAEALVPLVYRLKQGAEV
ncbi:MAG TPA: Holliday junction DNA helicase RuvA [Phycisphaerales bacterium]|nr:Holliday junction DNA helicase RuvA [Phycisphaerales bacterium]